ncbi:MAG: MaoC family dehydratase, partial [Pseudomonadales bacterium]
MVPPAQRPVQRLRTPWVNCATPDAIQHFSWGIGDDNPLWSSDDYARQSRWGGVIAPPCFLYAVDETTVTQDHADRRRVYRSADWTFYDVVSASAAIEANAALISESSTDDGIEQVGRVEFCTPDGGLLASAVVTCARPHGAALAIEDRPELRYTGDELNEIERTILSEERRGSAVREYESTSPGEEFGPLIKGPLSIMDVVAWCAATTGVVSQDA